MNFPIKTPTDTILWNSDQARLWLVLTFNKACVEGTPDFYNTLVEYGCTEYQQPEPNPPTENEIIQLLINSVQYHLDNTAQARGYDDIKSLASYAGDDDPVFNAEGTAGKSWRSACWRYCYNVLEDCKAQLRSIPTPEQLISELPTIQW